MNIWQHWEAWLLMIIVQISILIAGHFSIRDRYLNYWVAGLIGVSTWLFPVVITSMGLGLDPRPILLVIAAAIAMFGGVELEAITRRGSILSILFHTLIVLAVGLPIGAIVLWMAMVPPVANGWIEELIVSGISIVACGAITVALHYNDMVGGLDIYRKNGLTPGEHRTIADAAYILERKLQPRIGNVMAQMKRATEQVQSGLAGMNSASNLLSLVVMMLKAIDDGADETYIMSLVESLEVDNGLSRHGT
jgi:hypothetical protein